MKKYMYKFLKTCTYILLFPMLLVGALLLALLEIYDMLTAIWTD